MEARQSRGGPGQGTPAETPTEDRRADWAAQELEGASNVDEAPAGSYGRPTVNGGDTRASTTPDERATAAAAEAAPEAAPGGRGTPSPPSSSSPASNGGALVPSAGGEGEGERGAGGAGATSPPSSPESRPAPIPFAASSSQYQADDDGDLSSSPESERGFASVLERLREMMGPRGGAPPPEPRDPILEPLDVEGVAKFLRARLGEGGGSGGEGDAPTAAPRDAPRIVTMSGAGISVAAGIPDFRSPGTGLYHRLEEYELPHPQAIFEIDFFRENPHPFFTLARELWPGFYPPTKTHSFVRLLHEKGLLLRAYTQNIDSLETAAGIPQDKVVAAHGNFDAAHCIDCGARYPTEYVRRAVFGDDAGDAADRGVSQPDAANESLGRSPGEGAPDGGETGAGASRDRGLVADGSPGSATPPPSSLPLASSPAASSSVEGETRGGTEGSAGSATSGDEEASSIAAGAISVAQGHASDASAPSPSPTQSGAVADVSSLGSGDVSGFTGVVVDGPADSRSPGGDSSPPAPHALAAAEAVRGGTTAIAGGKQTPATPTEVDEDAAPSRAASAEVDPPAGTDAGSDRPGGLDSGPDSSEAGGEGPVDPPSAARGEDPVDPPSVATGSCTPIPTSRQAGVCRCPACGGLVKPDIVFFGENLPDRFYDLAEKDFPKAELLIVMGTSLVVQPFAGLIDRVGEHVPRLLINREVAGETDPMLRSLGYTRGFDFSSPHRYRDALFLGDSDSGVELLCDLLGWRQALEELHDSVQEAARRRKAGADSDELVRDLVDRVVGGRAGSGEEDGRPDAAAGGDVPAGGARVGDDALAGRDAGGGGGLETPRRSLEEEGSS